MTPQEHALLAKWASWCSARHDVYCNQKYNGLPYSFHLTMVYKNTMIYCGALEPTDQFIAFMVAWGHDLLEDARCTYNDTIQQISASAKEAGIEIHERLGRTTAEDILSCTELRGRDRGERHGAEFWELLRKRPIGAFVKLCDIMANTEFSYSQGHSMTKRYSGEWPHVKQELDCYKEQYAPLFEKIENLHKIFAKETVGA